MRKLCFTAFCKKNKQVRGQYNKCFIFASCTFKFLKQVINAVHFKCSTSQKDSNDPWFILVNFKWQKISTEVPRDLLCQRHFLTMKKNHFLLYSSIYRHLYRQLFKIFRNKWLTNLRVDCWFCFSFWHMSTCATRYIHTHTHTLTLNTTDDNTLVHHRGQANVLVHKPTPWCLTLQVSGRKIHSIFHTNV